MNESVIFTGEDHYLEIGTLDPNRGHLGNETGESYLKSMTSLLPGGVFAREWGARRLIYPVL